MLVVLVGPPGLAIYPTCDLREPAFRALHAMVFWWCWVERIVSIAYSVPAHMVDAVHRMADIARQQLAMMRIMQWTMDILLTGQASASMHARGIL